MAQRSHVPKFGNWDGDNVPYTAYFENARKEKVGGVRINPNDPEQNPEAFSIGGPRGGSSNAHHAVPASVSPDTKVAPRRFANQRSIYEQQKMNDSRKIMASESSSDKSPSDSSVTPVFKPNHLQKKSDLSKYSADDFSYRSASVPKFGQWDENDPRSADGFSVIFNKVKEEKQIAATKFPPVPSQTTSNYQISQEKETRKRFCCCLF